MTLWIIIWLTATVLVLCYVSFQKGQLDIIADDLKLFEVYIEAAQEKNDQIERLEKRINAMQELIDYNEWMVHNAISALYEKGWKKRALDYLELHYVVGDEEQYRLQEKMDEEDEEYEEYED